MKKVLSIGRERVRTIYKQEVFYDEVPLKDGGTRKLETYLLLPFVKGGKPLPEKMPCIVWVCGGGWFGGTGRAPEMLPELQFLSEAGFIIAAASYRIPTQACFPAQIEDVLSCVRYLKANAAQYHIDPERIGIFGSSAGGNLTLLAANNDHRFDTDAWHTVSSEVKCACAFYPPTDLFTTYIRTKKLIAEGKNDPRMPTPEQSPEYQLIGEAPEEGSEKAKSASPVFWINEKTCPVLLMHGLDDHTVPCSQSDEYYEASLKKGKEITYYQIPNADHNTDEFYQPEVKEIVLQFFQKYLCL